MTKITDDKAEMIATQVAGTIKFHARMVAAKGKKGGAGDWAREGLNVWELLDDEMTAEGFNAMTEVAGDMLEGMFDFPSWVPQTFVELYDNGEVKVHVVEIDFPKVGLRERDIPVPMDFRVMREVVARPADGPEKTLMVDLSQSPPNCPYWNQSTEKMLSWWMFDENHLRGNVIGMSGVKSLMSDIAKMRRKEVYVANIKMKIANPDNVQWMEKNHKDLKDGQQQLDDVNRKVIQTVLGAAKLKVWGFQAKSFFETSLDMSVNDDIRQSMQDTDWAGYGDEASGEKAEWLKTWLETDPKFRDLPALLEFVEGLTYDNMPKCKAFFTEACAILKQEINNRYAGRDYDDNGNVIDETSPEFLALKAKAEKKAAAMKKFMDRKNLRASQPVNTVKELPKSSATV